jgi:hypothetical protein
VGAAPSRDSTPNHEHVDDPSSTPTAFAPLAQPNNQSADHQAPTVTGPVDPGAVRDLYGIEEPAMAGPEKAKRDDKDHCSKFSDKELEAAQEEDQKNEAALTKSQAGRRRESLNEVATLMGDMAARSRAHIMELKADAEEVPAEPSLLESLLNVALSAGAASFGLGVGLRFAKHLEKKLAVLGTHGEEVGAEFVKTVIEEGIKTGQERGKQHLEGVAKTKSQVMEKFLLAQADGAQDMYICSREHFSHVDKQKVRTAEGAEALEEATKESIPEEAEKQKGRARDAWVSYLAQTRFGTIKHNGEITTNMDDQDQRDHARLVTDGMYGDPGIGIRIRHSVGPEEGHGEAPEGDRGGERRKGSPFDDHVTGDAESAPDMKAALFKANGVLHGGIDQGVLHVSAVLPDIKPGEKPDKATVKVAILNGVSDSIREEYNDKTLSELHIPRHVTCKTGGSYNDFGFSLDERGNQFDSMSAEDMKWLVARARAEGDGYGGPGASDGWLALHGLYLLLDELRTEKVIGKE